MISVSVPKCKHANVQMKNKVKYKIILQLKVACFLVPSDGRGAAVHTLQRGACCLGELLAHASKGFRSFWASVQVL